MDRKTDIDKQWLFYWTFHRTEVQTMDNLFIKICKVFEI